MTALRLLEEGCKVAIFDLAPSRKGFTEQLNLLHYAVDISNEPAVARAFVKVKEALGPVDILINTPAAFIFNGVEAIEADWQTVLSVNVQSTSFMAKYATEHMKEKGRAASSTFRW